MKRGSGLRIVLLVVALLAARAGPSAEEQRFLLLAEPSEDGPIDSGFRSTSHYNRGVAFQKKDDNDKAIAEYRESIRLCSTLWRPAYNLATALHNKGELDAAARCNTAT